MMQGHTSEARLLSFYDQHLRHLFPHLPQQARYNKRLRKPTGTLNWLVGALASDTVRRSDLAGWAEYGYHAGHPRPDHRDLAQRPH